MGDVCDERFAYDVPVFQKQNKNHYAAREVFRGGGVDCQYRYPEYAAYCDGWRGRAQKRNDLTRDILFA